MPLRMFRPPMLTVEQIQQIHELWQKFLVPLYRDEKYWCTTEQQPTQQVPK